jgi:hypothetical protein
LRNSEDDFGPESEAWRNAIHQCKKDAVALLKELLGRFAAMKKYYSWREVYKREIAESDIELGKDAKC